MSQQTLNIDSALLSTIETHSSNLSTYLRIELEHFGSFEWHKIEPYLQRENQTKTNKKWT